MANAGEHGFVGGERGDDEFFGSLKVADSGEEIEEIGGVFAEVRMGGKEREIGIEFGGAGVVVAGAEVDIAAEAIFVAANHEGDFAMDLVVDDSVDDVDAGFFEAASPGDIIGFVEAGFEFDDGGDLFAIADGFHEGADDPGVATGAVEGLFDGEDLGVGGGLLEKIDDAGEVFVGVMNEDVALADDGEEIIGTAKAGGDGGDERFIAEFWGVIAFTDCHEAHGVERAIDQVEVIFLEVESFEEELGDFGGASVIEFEANGVAFPAIMEFVFDRFEEVTGVGFVDVELAISGDAEVPETENFCSWKEIGEVMADELAEVDKIASIAIAGEANEAGEDARDLDNGEASIGVTVAFDFELDDDIEGFVEELGEGVGGIDAEWGEDWADIGAVIGFEPGAIVGVKVGIVEDVNVIFGESGEEIIAPAAVSVFDHGADSAVDGAVDFAGGFAIDAPFDDLAFDLLFEAGDADFEKLIEIGVGNREEFDAFEEGVGGVEGFVENALIEFEPTEFATEKVRGLEFFHEAGNFWEFRSGERKDQVTILCEGWGGREGGGGDFFLKGG